MSSDYSAMRTNAITSPLFGQTFLRDLLLPDLLGEQQSNILYWAGRELAIKLPTAEADVPALFEQAGLGTLSLLSSKKAERHYQLTGDVVQARLDHIDQPDFQLEAGFLAQLLQQDLGIVVEANSQPDAKRHSVELIVGLDPKEAQPTASPLIDDLVD